MSFDPNQNTPPMGHVPPKKSGGALKWILGGLGCFGLLALCCFGGLAYIGYQGVQMVTGNPGYLEARATLESSDALGEAVGNPVTVGEPQGEIKPTPNGDRIGFEYTVPVSGPNGSGTATFKVDGKPFTDDWSVESMSVEVNGEEVQLEGGGFGGVNIEGE